MVKQKSNCISMREACYNYKKFSLIKHQKVLDWFMFYMTECEQNMHLKQKTYYGGINKSLQNLQLDYVDVVFVHQFDADTSTNQIVRGFNQIIEDGKTFYWDTGNWNAAQIQEAINYVDTHGLIRPIAEQGEYYMLQMKQFEVYLVGVYEKYNQNATIYSPLCGGFLTGKYLEVIQKDNRCANDNEWMSKESAKKRWLLRV